MHLQLAWRNIWRNSRRTTIITIAVVVGVWSMLLVSAFNRGMINQMVRNAIATLTGDVQIHCQGYRSDPAIENSINDLEKVKNILTQQLPKDTDWSSRIRVNAIVSNALHSTGVTLVGIDPESEARISFVGRAVINGHYLSAKDTHGILIGKALADKFDTGVGRKLVLMSQDTNKVIASRAFRIIGVFQAELETTEMEFVFVVKSSAQEMLKVGNGISEISIVFAHQKNVSQLVASLKSVLPSDYAVNTWQELLPIITAYLSIMDGWIFIWYIVVFIAMGFGIVNTLLMAVFERTREFGLFAALGMKPWWIIKGVLLESLFLLTLGLVIGNTFGLISIIFLNKSGIDLSALGAGAEYVGLPRIIYPVMHVQDIILANAVVFVLGLAIRFYPAAKAARLTPVESLTHT
jgi:ABC-type lipoprotein release transport system permease subunit